MIPTPVHVHHLEHSGRCYICDPHPDPEPQEHVLACRPTDLKLWMQATNVMLWLALVSEELAQSE